MTKFQKRILKTREKLENCLLIGEGFGFLEDCLEIFSTVFVINEKTPTIRVKNLIFRNDNDQLSQISEITHIFFDRDKITMLENYQHLWLKHNAVVVIEGDNPIEREFSKSLYGSHWQCTNTLGYFHIWEQIK